MKDGGTEQWELATYIDATSVILQPRLKKEIQTIKNKIPKPGISYTNTFCISGWENFAFSSL